MRKYVFTVANAINNAGKVIPGVYDLDCNECCCDGTRKLLHNEISARFKVKGNEMYILSGWHIGTEDYDLDEGDDYTIERYHPGLTEQVLEYLKGKGVIE